MFKKLEDLSKPTLLSKTGVKELKQSFNEQYPFFKEVEDEIFPKKSNIQSFKLRSEYKVEIVQVDKDYICFTKEDLVVPHLKLVHKFPDLIIKQQVDAGAIKHILSGSDVLAPGLISQGGQLNQAQKGQVVAIYGEGKENAMGIGIMNASSDEIKKDPKGHAIQLLHHLGDALWQLSFK
ncbi:unnamed protein product [Paramecium primaurelia]|uniref:PUA domain-containing protein n=1 Tax=Paramecium primaurelia TaxID=5886 RepID=A0A8S1NMM8_PARPR|nr:unnamed protein product [Paramecium primaurelia]